LGLSHLKHVTFFLNIQSESSRPPPSVSPLPPHETRPYEKFFLFLPPFPFFLSHWSQYQEALCANFRFTPSLSPKASPVRWPRPSLRDNSCKNTFFTCVPPPLENPALFNFRFFPTFSPLVAPRSQRIALTFQQPYSFTSSFPSASITLLWVSPFSPSLPWGTRNNYFCFQVLSSASADRTKSCNPLARPLDRSFFPSIDFGWVCRRRRCSGEGFCNSKSFNQLS